jgi:hypothetical protein
MITFPARPASPRSPAPDSLGDDPALTRRWLIETALLWARWGQIPLIALLPVFLRAHPWPPPLLGALVLALGNAGLTRLWRRGPSAARLIAIRRGATAFALLMGKAVAAFPAEGASLGQWQPVTDSDKFK